MNITPIRLLYIKLQLENSHTCNPFSFFSHYFSIAGIGSSRRNRRKVNLLFWNKNATWQIPSNQLYVPKRAPRGKDLIPRTAGSEIHSIGFSPMDLLGYRVRIPENLDIYHLDSSINLALLLLNFSI
jgi:hypothetical protein